MQEYKRYKPFNKGLFTRLVNPAKGKDEPKSVELVIDYEAELNPTHVQEAAEKGLKLLYRSSNRTYGFFEKPCGHTAFLHYGAVRKARGEHKCSDCIVDEYSEAAKRVNFKLMAKMGNKGIYRCNDCGLDSLIDNANIRNCKQEKFTCRHCLNALYKKEAGDAGVVLLSTELVEDNKRLYLLPCGHTKNMLPVTVRNKAFMCRICQTTKYHEEAKRVGIEYLPELGYLDFNKRFYKLSCGCVKELSVKAVRDNAFECKLHRDRHIDFSVPIHVYLVKLCLDGLDVLKLGFTMDLDGKSARFIRYGIPKKNVEPILIVTFANGEDGVSFEREMHRKYKNFTIDKNLLRTKMQNGFTECYPAGMLEILKQELLDMKESNQCLKKDSP